MKRRHTLRPFLLACGSLLAASSLHAATLYWDATPGTADGASDGGAGTWDTATANWDDGAAYQIWNNANNDTAVFGGTADTVTLGGAISLQTLSLTNLSTTNKYTIDGGTLNFAPGGTITTASTNAANFVDFAFITSAITGSPDIVHGFSGGNNQLVIAPTSGSVTLGTITGDGITRLAGSTTGNSLVAASSNNAKLRISSGTWEVTGLASAYEHFIDGGEVILNTGTLRNNNRAVQLNGGTLHYNHPGAVWDFRSTFLNGNNFDFKGGSLDNTSGAAITTSDYDPDMTFAADWTFIGSNGANSDLYLGDGRVLLTGAREVTIQHADTTLSLAGVIQDGGSGHGVTKAGPGTLELLGANTYTGNTAVNVGTLALVGGSQSSAITVATGASLGFTLGSPTTSTSTVNLTTGTVKITGTPVDPSYLLMTADGGITGTPTLDAAISGYELVLANGDTELRLNSTGGLSAYDTWSGGAAFGDDANGDGVSNGLAFLLGALDPNVDALGLLPTPTEDGSGGLVMTFSMLNAASRGTAALSVEHSSDLGIGDAWTTVLVPESTPDPQASDVSFTVTPNGSLNDVVATIAAGEAAAGKLFGRLKATE